MNRAAILMLSVVVVTSCDHTTPFGLEDPEPVGPSSPSPPIQLTFNIGRDRHPAVSGSVIVYSRLERQRADDDRCLAILPAAGGTLLDVFCAGGSHPDSMTDAWVEPARDSEGRLAYVRDRGRPNAYGPLTRSLVVAAPDDPDSLEFELPLPFQLGDGRDVTGIRQMSWSGAGTVRFLAGEEAYYPGSDVFPDTLFTPFRVIDLAVGSGDRREYPSTESASFYVTAPDGGIWFTQGLEVYHLAAADESLTLIGAFTGSVLSLTEVSGRPTASVQRVIVPPSGGVSTWTEIEWLELDSGLPGGSMRTPGSAGRISGVPGAGQLVAEIVGAGQTNLWLLAVP